MGFKPEPGCKLFRGDSARLPNVALFPFCLLKKHPVFPRELRYLGYSL